MELNTRASLSIILEEIFSQLEMKAELEKSSVTLKTYSGESLGKLNVTVIYESQSSELSVLVVKGKGPCLLGRDWLGMLKINWQKLFQLQSQDRLQELLK